MTTDNAYFGRMGHQPTTRSDQLVQEIARYILKTGLVNGDPIPPEPELQRILGCSRNSIREAIKVMEAVGMVEVRRGTGTFVAGNPLAPLTPALIFQGMLSLNSGGNEAKDIITLRRGLEVAFLPIVMKYVAEDDAAKQTLIAQLQDTVEEMAAAERAGSSTVDLDYRFHNQLFAPLRSRTLKQLNDAILNVYFSLLEAVAERFGEHPVFESDPSSQPLATAHQGIVDAIAAGNGEEAVERLLNHYQPLSEAIDSVIAAREER